MRNSRRISRFPTEEDKAFHGDYFDDDPAPFSETAVVDSEEASLRFRVGSVHDLEKTRAEPGIWIFFQSPYMKSDLQGPVLISKETWDVMNRTIRLGFLRHNRRKTMIGRLINKVNDRIFMLERELEFLRYEIEDYGILKGILSFAEEIKEEYRSQTP